MRSPKIAFRETGIIAIGQAVCTAVMVAVFALLGKYNTSVLLGGIVGGFVATANFFFMAFFATLSAEKAKKQDVTGGQKLIHLSYMVRMAIMFAILALCAKSGLFHVLALVLPLLFTRPILTAAEIFKKEGDANV